MDRTVPLVTSAAAARAASGENVVLVIAFAGLLSLCWWSQYMTSEDTVKGRPVRQKLHTVKWMYKYLHSTHHQYNKMETMTPWCSIAFNPIDGILQAAPYLLALPVVPVHYFTHIFLLFFSGVWATNIHDSVPMNSEPLMGAQYHTIHHTHYHYNFGQWFIFCDYIFGTLRSRADLDELKKEKKL